MRECVIFIAFFVSMDIFTDKRARAGAIARSRMVPVVRMRRHLWQQRAR